MDFELVCVILYLVVGICIAAYALFQVQYRAAQQAGRKVQKLQAELESLQRDGSLVDNTAQTWIADLSDRIRYLSTPRWKFELDKAALIVWLWPFFVVHLVWTLIKTRLEPIQNWFKTGLDWCVQKLDHLSTRLWAQLMKQ